LAPFFFLCFWTLFGNPTNSLFIQEASSSSSSSSSSMNTTGVAPYGWKEILAPFLFVFLS
jgi:hypothetical protein